MTLRHLKIFLAIYETGSTTAAAQTLHIAQPSVSTALRELEDHYGVPVFERYAKRLRVTEAGRQLYPYAKHLTALFDEAEDVMRSMGTAGTLRVGTSITIAACCLPRLIRKFQEMYPRMTIRVTTENTDAVVRQLLANELDVGLVEGEVHSPFLVVEPYRVDHLTLVCRPDHPFAQAADVIDPGKARFPQPEGVSLIKVAHIGYQTHIVRQNRPHRAPVVQKPLLRKLRRGHQEHIPHAGIGQFFRQPHRVVHIPDKGGAAPQHIGCQAAEFAVDAAGLDVQPDLPEQQPLSRKRLAGIVVGFGQKTVIRIAAHRHAQQRAQIFFGQILALGKTL